MNDIDYNNLNPYDYNGDDPLHYETAFPGHPNKTNLAQNGSNNTCGTQFFTAPLSNTSLYPLTVPPYHSLRLTSSGPFMTSIAGDLQPQIPACSYPYIYGMQNAASMSGQVPTTAITEPGYGMNLPVSLSNENSGSARAVADHNVSALQKTTPAEGTAKTYYASKHLHQKKLETERKRRKALCSAYEELRSVLPPAARRGFKSDVMAAAAEEIRRLRAEVQHYKQTEVRQ